MKRRLPAFLLLLAFTGAVVPGRTVQAQSTPHVLSRTAAVLTLQAYGIVDQKPEAELRLQSPVTRAELAKVLGAAMKLQEQEKVSHNTPAFPDTGEHWANGWIAAAKARGLFRGREDGLFHPQDPVTYAEVITALLRLAGRAQDAVANWPYGAIFAAAEANMIPGDMDLADHWHEPAARGDLFRLTAMAAGRVTLPNTGLTVLQMFHDQTPPGLDVSLFPTVVGQRSFTVTGRAPGAVTVSVNGVQAEVAPDGTFMARVDLLPGANRVPVVASDGAGNRAEVSAPISVQVLSRLEFMSGTIETAAGLSFTPVVMRYDSGGRPLPAEFVSYSFDPSALTREASGAFKALKSGAYTLKAFLDGREATARVIVAGDPAQIEVKPDYATMVAGGVPVPVRIRVLDEQGRLNPQGSVQVQLSTVPANAAAFDRSSVTTRGGTAVIYVAPGPVPGGFGIQAKGSGARPVLSPLVPISVEQRRVAGIELQTVPANLPAAPGRRVTVVATAVDQVGAPVPVNADTLVSLSSTNTAVLRLTQEKAVIKAGAASSDFGGTDGAGAITGVAGTAEIRARHGSLSSMNAKVAVANAGALSGLRVRVLHEAARADDLTAALVEVARVDRNGEVATTDETPVVLLTQVNGVSVSPIAEVGGVTTFAVRSSMAGRVDLTAGVPGRPELNSEPVEVAFVGGQAGARSAIRVGSNRAIAGESVPVYVSLEAPTGGFAVNPGPPMRFQLQAGNGAALSHNELIIPSGATRSEEVRMYVPSGVSSVTVSGSLVGGKPLPGANVSVYAPPPSPQPPNLPHLAVVGPDPGRSPVAGEETRFVIQAREGASLRQGSHAFDLKVKINGRELTAFPDNLKVSLGGNSVQYITGRTVNGEAEVWVNYAGTGTVELVPVPKGAVGNAYDHWGVQGSAASTVSNTVLPARTTYVAGPLHRLDVSVEHGLGGSLEALIRAARGRYAIVRLKPVDSYGNPAGDTCVGRLAQVGGSPAPSLAIRTAWGDLPEHTAPISGSGAATFTVVSVDGAEAWSEWAPSMVCGNQALAVPQNVRISTTLASALTPIIESAGGDVSGEGILDGDDAYLKVRIALDTRSPNLGELLVYDGAVLLGRFGPIKPNSSVAQDRTVLIPKTLLNGASGALLLKAQLNTGAMVTPTSATRTVQFSRTP